MLEADKFQQEVKSALLGFSKRYVDTALQLTSQLPKTGDYQDLESPCVVEQLQQGYLTWQPVERKLFHPLLGVERGMEMLINPSIHTLFGIQFCADMPLEFNGIYMNLLQVWNDEDFIRLQENIIGHLAFLQKAKRKPTVFIATTQDDDQIISCCNITGQVFTEYLSKDKKSVLSDSLVSFLQQAIPWI